MTMTTPAPRRRPDGLALVECQHQQVQKTEPAGHAPEQAHDEAVLELVPFIGGCVHNTAILSLLAPGAGVMASGARLRNAALS